MIDEFEKTLGIHTDGCEAVAYCVTRASLVLDWPNVVLLLGSAPDVPRPITSRFVDENQAWVYRSYDEYLSSRLLGAKVSCLELSAVDSVLRVYGRGQATQTAKDLAGLSLWGDQSV